MALFFLFSRFLWYAFPRQGGVNIRRLVRNNRDEDKGLKVAQQTLKLYLDAQTEFQGIVGCNYPCRRFYYGHTLAYFSVKLLYVTNTISQYFLLNTFLSFHFHSYGVEVSR
jgi:hypothetical protein